MLPGNGNWNPVGISGKVGCGLAVRASVNRRWIEATVTGRTRRTAASMACDRFQDQHLAVGMAHMRKRFLIPCGGVLANQRKAFGQISAYLALEPLEERSLLMRRQARPLCWERCPPIRPGSEPDSGTPPAKIG